MKTKLFLIALFACILNIGVMATDPGPMTKEVENTYWKAVKYYQEGNYCQALLLFECVMDSNPENAELNFYTGMCYYNLNKLKIAKRYFGIAANDNYCRIKIILFARDQDEENVLLSYNQ